MINPYLFGRLFFLSAFILLLDACRKPEDHDNAEYVIKEVSSRNMKTSYEYNDAWQITKASFVAYGREGYSRTISYFYDTNGRLEQTETTHSGSSGKQLYIANYTYNNQGRLTAVKTVRNNPLLTYDDVYDYNGQTITLTHSVNSVVNSVSTYTVDDRGNIVKAVTDDQTPGNNDYTEEWQNYDDKKNMNSPVVGDVTSKNNHRRYIRYMPRQNTWEVLIGYTYNGAGYVIDRKDYYPAQEDMRSTKYELIRKQ